MKYNTERLDAPLSMRIPTRLKKQLQEEAARVQENLPGAVRFTPSNYVHTILDYFLEQDGHLQIIMASLGHPMTTADVAVPDIEE